MYTNLMVLSYYFPILTYIITKRVLDKFYLVYTLNSLGIFVVNLIFTIFHKKYIYFGKQNISVKRFLF